MFGTVVNLNQYLYHYTSREIFFEHIFPNLRFRMNQYTRTNDPRESKDWYIGIEHDNDEDPYEFTYLRNHCDHIHDHFNNKVKRRLKLACFSMDNEKAMKPPAHEFGRGYGHSRMWAQYGENHRGLCLIFDKEELERSFSKQLRSSGKLYFGDVQYRDTPHHEIEGLSIHIDQIKTNGVDKSILFHINNYYKTLFFEKSEDWAYEYEYRILLFSDDEEFKFIDIKSALKGICLGVDFPEVYIPLLKEIRQKYGIRFARMSWYNAQPMACEWPE